MDLLISFVNQSFTPNLKLGLLDVDSGDFRWVVDNNLDVGVGATGIAATDSNVYICAQQNDLMVLDESGVIQSYKSPGIEDPHSLYLDDGHLFCVSTGSNEIYELILAKDGLITGESVYWRATNAGCGYDSIHLNSMTMVNGSMYVTAFGHRSCNQLWTTIDHGFIKKLTSPTQYPGTRQPHSISYINNAIYYCESKSGSVQILESGLRYNIGGYTRGLAADGETLFVGSSHRRKISKSTGKILKGRVGEFENSLGQCRVTAVDLTSGAIKRTYDLSAYANEIYEILANPPSFVQALSSADPLLLRIESFEDNAALSLEAAETLVSEQMVKQTAELISEVNVLNSKVDVLTKQLAAQKATAAERASNITRLESQIMELESKLSRTIADLSDLSSKADNFVSARRPIVKYRHYKSLKAYLESDH